MKREDSKFDFDLSVLSLEELITVYNDVDDFISFLECNVKTPMHRLLLQRAFVEMTLPKDNNNNNNHSYEKEKEKDKNINIGDFIKQNEFMTLLLVMLHCHSK